MSPRIFQTQSGGPSGMSTFGPETEASGSGGDIRGPQALPKQWTNSSGNAGRGSNPGSTSVRMRSLGFNRRHSRSLRSGTPRSSAARWAFRPISPRSDDQKVTATLATCGGRPDRPRSCVQGADQRAGQKSRLVDCVEQNETRRQRLNGRQTAMSMSEPEPLAPMASVLADGWNEHPEAA